MSKKPQLKGNQITAADPELYLPAVVTAAAGSGKTFVLVERVIALICDRSNKTSIDSLAIMTFTRNAAKSMREKLNKALDEKIDELNEKILELKADPSREAELAELKEDYTYVKDQKFKLRQTVISTIDAFCVKMIKENIELFDLPVNFALADNAKKAAYQVRAINQAMQEFYDERGSFTKEERNTLFYTFNFSDDEDLQKAVVDFGNNLESYVNADEWLAKAQDVYKDEKSLEAQYSDAYEDFLDAYFTRTADPAGRKGVMQKYFEKYYKIIDIIIRDVHDFQQECNQKINELRATGGANKDIKSYSSKIESAQKIIDQIIPTIQSNVAAEKAGYEPIYDAYDKYKSNKSISSLCAVFDALKYAPEPKAAPKGGSNDIKSKTLITKNKNHGIELVEELNSYSFDRDNLKNQQTAVRAMIKLEKLYIKHYQAMKTDSGFVDFSDCELMLLNKLKDEKNEGFRKSLQERFKYIIVDEFQDCNDIQAELFRLIGCDNLFYVGDIKQSIYAFRGGNPAIMARFVEGKDGFKPVALSKNFRSRKTVLDFVNKAFSGLMTKEYGDVEYNDKENLLECGAKYLYYPDSEEEVPDEKFDPVDTDKYCAEIHFLSGEASKEDKDMRQPRFVAKRIKELIDDPDFLITKGEKRVRPTYSDFYVLLRGNKRIPYYRKALSELCIPSTTPKGKEFLKSDEIEYMLDLLAVIDNPLKDEEMLKVLMSPIYGFSAEDVTDVRLGLLGIDKEKLDEDIKKKAASIYRNRSLYKCLKDSENKLRICVDKEKDEYKEFERTVPKKLTRFMSQLNDFRYCKSTNSLHKLVCKIYEDTDAELVAAVFEDSAQRVANVRRFSEMAADFEENNGGSLGDFLRFIGRVKSNDNEKVEDASPTEDSMNAVQIMTFHASKGLEAPICILCELENKVHKGDYTNTFLNNRENYFAMQNVDYKKRVASYSFAYNALRLLNKKKMIGEELRLLYVAFTRAQEKLIMVTENDYKDFYESELYPQNPTETFFSEKAFEWVLQSLARYDITENKFDDFNCKLFDEEFFVGDAPEKPKDETEEFDVPSERTEALNSKINFEYAHIKDTVRQEKFTATELAHRNSDTPIVLAKPDFDEKKKNKKLVGPEKGNAYHNCMQYIEFKEFKKTGGDDPADIAKREIDRLAEAKRLNEQEADCIEPEKIAGFFTSSLGQRVLAAEKVEREEETFARVKGSEIGEDDLQEIMLQGRVDMYFIEDGEIVVVDYKTDTEKNLIKEKKNYAKQVKIYSNVLKKLKGINVKEVYLYSFEDGKAIKV